MVKRILITGAGGYIGSRMVERYLKEGKRIIALDRYFFGDVFQDLKRNKNLQVVKEDIRFLKVGMFKNVDCVIDLASISNDASGSLNPKLTRDVNYKGPVLVAKLAKKAGVPRYIFSSSCSVYGKNDGLVNEKSKTLPLTEYAKSKILAEKDLLKMADDSFTVTILRNATVYGLSKRRMRFDLMVNLMTLTAWRDKKILIYCGGRQWRPLIHIDDCIDAFTLICDSKEKAVVQKQVFNIGSTTQNYQVLTVARMFKKCFPKIKIEQSSDYPESRDYHVNFDKAKKVLGFTPERSIEDAIREIHNSLKKGEIQADLRTNTMNYYEYLIKASALLETIKIKGKLHL